MTATLRRLVLKCFRSLQSAAVEFDNPTFLVGQNGAGKSNIVDALALLAEARTSPLSAALEKRGGVGAVGHRSSPRGRLPDVGLRVELVGLTAAREATYAFELRCIKGYDYRVRREQCRCTAQDGTTSWFDRRGDAFRSSIETRLALASNALALPLVAGDERFAPVRSSSRTSNPIASTQVCCAKCRTPTPACVCVATAATPPACFVS